MPIEIRDELIDEAVKRKMAEEEYAPKEQKSPASSTTLSPTMAAMLGAVADGASTYNFLKRGTATEDNAMFAGLNNNPAATGLAAAGTGLAVPLLGRLLRGKLPDKFIDTIVANMGAHTLGVAGGNLDGTEGLSSMDQLHNALTRNATGREK